MLESSTLEKQHAFQGMLLTGRVLVWPRMSHEGLVVPDALRTMPPAPLAYTPDVCPEVTKEGIAALMWFGGEVFDTVLPWKAVFFMASKRGHLSWLEDAPAGMIDDKECVFNDPDAEFFDEVDAATLYAEAMARTGSAAGVVTSSEPADAQSPERSGPGGAHPAANADTASSTATSVPRASSPSLKVILGGGQDDED